MQQYRFVWIILLMLATSCAQRENKTGTDRQQRWLTERNRIAAELGRLSTDLEKTSWLRNYCGRLIDIGRPDPATIRFLRSTTLNNMQLDEYYHLFETDSIPADCGITSYFYIKLAQSFGYKCYQYSFGFTGGGYERYIHSFPVVEIDYNGQQKMIVEDPYLNLQINDKTGAPMDFYEFLQLLKKKKYGEIVIDSATVETHLLVSDTLQYWPFLNDSCRKLLRNMIVRPDGRVLKKITFRRNYSNLMQSACDNFERQFVQALNAHNYREPFIYAYTLRANTMTGSEGVKKVEKKIDLLLDTVVDD